MRYHVQSVVTLKEAVWVWCRIAALSFGGPAGQIAVMHRILVDEKKWIREDQFLHALSYCMLLPGPEAQQLATYTGWLLHRWPGGLLAGGLFILPGFVSIMLLSVVYALYQDLPLLMGVFFGLKCGVIAIVAQAVLRIGRRVLTDRTAILMAITSFVLIFFFATPFPVILLLAAGLGAARVRWSVGNGNQKGPREPAVPAIPENVGKTAPSAPLMVQADQAAGGRTLAADADHSDAADQRGGSVSFDVRPVGSRPLVQPSAGRSLRILLLFLVIWFAPMAVLVQLFGVNSVFVREAVFFSKTAVLTFGGAYAVLAYIAQQAVEQFHWLQPGEMLDGLGMAETTPGPLIMVVQFVGFMGAFRYGELESPVWAGILGAVITTWVTFVPCFLWIFLGAPYVEQLRGNRLLNSMMTTITAAVVGVIVNLAVWFGLHTLFSSLRSASVGPLHVLVPDLSRLNPSALGITLFALFLTLWWQRGMAVVLMVCAALGVLLFDVH